MIKNKKIIIIVGVILILIVVGCTVIYNSLFGAPQKQAELEQFVSPLPLKNGEIAIEGYGIPRLKAEDFIKSEFGFKVALRGAEIQPGAYKISKAMNAWEVANVIRRGPYMKWVVIPEGLRKEQIAEILATELGWNEQEKSDWVTKYTAMNYDYIEGVYFPDTYLMPRDETGLEIAQRFINKFNEEFAPYSAKFIKANIKWDTALKIASLIERETGSKDDMPLIAGIIWNRLLIGMRLDIDATLQYARGNTGNGWWAPITVADKQIDSPYNTYLYSGLPPHPICNPGLDAIGAVLNPTETKCLYYLHDSNRQIHCAVTYEEHKVNIEKYLK
jgi:UPF0755 protein